MPLVDLPTTTPKERVAFFIRHLVALGTFSSLRAVAAALEMGPTALTGYTQGLNFPGERILGWLSAQGCSIDWIIRGGPVEQMWYNPETLRAAESTIDRAAWRHHAAVLLELHAEAQRRADGDGGGKVNQ